MSLVAYASSEEDSEPEFIKEQDVVSSSCTDKQNFRDYSVEDARTESSVDSTQSFMNLPPCRSELEDVSWNLLSKDLKYPVRIMAPKIPEACPEDVKKKPIKPSGKGSGLFSLLPSPKQHLSLQPKKVQTSKPKPPAPAPKTKTTPQKEKKMPDSSHDANKKQNEYSDSDDEEAIDFFFTFENKDEETVSTTVQDPVDTVEEASGQSSAAQNPTSAPQDVPPPPLLYAVNIDSDHPSFSENLEAQKEFESIQLDDFALSQLCGSHAKRRKLDGSELIDVNAAALLPDSNEWLTKDLTTEQARPSHRKMEGPTSQQRRKHQITYLAFQAKEHELELKNQWAQNRMTRKQTQAKYGF